MALDAHDRPPPFRAGLLMAVPIVGRELETVAAQTAWSLEASRVRWLLRRSSPIALVVGLAMVLTAAATEALAARELGTHSSAMAILGLHGLPAIARLMGAFGLGLLAGAVVPRTLPALVIGGVLCVLLSMGVSSGYHAWLEAQPSLPRLPGETRWWAFDGQWGELAADEQLLTEAQARALVPDEVEALEVPGCPSRSTTASGSASAANDPGAHGHPRPRGCRGLAPLDVLLYGGAGVVGVLAASIIVDSRRPT